MGRVPSVRRTPGRGARADAELFFEDLVGVSRAPATEAVDDDLADQLSESVTAMRSEADAFFADLMGESLPGADWGAGWRARRVVPYGGSATESPPPVLGWTGSALAVNRAPGTFFGVRRIPVDGLTGVRRALVLLPPDFDESRRVDLLFHLHGANRGYDDPQGSPRDLDPSRDRIEEQLAAAHRPQLLVVLPQGADADAYYGALARLDPRTYSIEALDALVAGSVLRAAPTIGRIVLSGHSGGGFAMKSILDVPAKRRDVAGALWFDAIQAEAGPADRRHTTGQREMAKSLLREHISAELAGSGGSGDLFELHAYYDAQGYYVRACQEVERDIRALFGEARATPPTDAVGATLVTRLAQLSATDRAALRARYQVKAVPRATTPATHEANLDAGNLDTFGHDNIVGSNALKDALETMPFGR
jgi:hypothetical protein